MTRASATRRFFFGFCSVSLAIALVVAPTRSDAVQFDTTCSVAAQGIISGNDILVQNLIGQSVGVTGMLANLVCFVGDSRCTCLRRATDSDRIENDRFVEALASVLAGCAFSSNSGRRYSGVIQEAALTTCR